MNVNDDTFETTPLGWALHAWSSGPPRWASDGYHNVVTLLVAAGAIVQEEWQRNEGQWSRLATKISEDPRMRAILTEGR